MPVLYTPPKQRKRNNHTQTQIHVSNTHLVRMENLQEGFVDVWLSLEPILDLVDIVDGMIKLHGLIVLQGWCGAQRDCHRRVRLHRRRARRCIRWNRWRLLAGRSMSLQLRWLERTQAVLASSTPPHGQDKGTFNPLRDRYIFSGPAETQLHQRDKMPGQFKW